VFALEKTLASCESEHSDVFKHAKAEAHALEELSKANAVLNQYQNTFGNLLSLPPDIAQLAEQLQLKETELEKLRLVIREFETVCASFLLLYLEIKLVGIAQNQSSLYSELDQLAVQWESLDKQVKSKVFNLNNMEERLLRSVTEVGFSIFLMLRLKLISNLRKPRLRPSSLKLLRPIRLLKPRGKHCKRNSIYRTKSFCRHIRLWTSSRPKS